MEMKQVFFNKSKEELQKTLDNYIEKVPESLSSQFTNRLKKAEAVTTQKKRKIIEKKLHPSCKNT